MISNLVLVRNTLREASVSLCNRSDDGRVNSCLDEYRILKILLNDPYLSTVIKVPDNGKRWWYDFAILNDSGEYVPVNIKSTTLQTADNTGNMTVAVQAYTQYSLDLTKKYNNGKLCSLLLSAFVEEQLNDDYNKDYYFLVVNKNKPNDITINSVLGLHKITYNCNNLPFQVKWCNNRVYQKCDIRGRVREFVMAYTNTNSWKAHFFSTIRKIEL